jgi:hypothetical protein
LVVIFEDLLVWDAGFAFGWFLFFVLDLCFLLRYDKISSSCEAQSSDFILRFPFGCEVSDFFEVLDRLLDYLTVYFLAVRFGFSLDSTTVS